MEDLAVQMPKMMMGKELEEAMLSLPPYDPAICQGDAAERLMALNCNAALYSRRKPHFIFDRVNTITARSFR